MRRKLNFKIPEGDKTYIEGYNFPIYSHLINEHTEYEFKLYVGYDEKIGELRATSLEDILELIPFAIKYWDKFDETISKIKDKGTITLFEFRILTFACKSGTEDWMNERGHTIDEELDIEYLLKESYKTFKHRLFKRFDL